MTLRHSSSPVEFASNYLGIIKPLIKNLSLAYYLSLGTYGIDHLVMGRLGISAFSISSTRNLIKRIMSGGAWYYQVPMSMIKFSVLKGPQVILKGGNLIKRIMSGGAWYYQVPMSMIKFSVLKGPPQVILKGILHG